MRRLNCLFAVFLLVVLLLVLASCERELSEAEANAAVSIIEPTVNDFFQGLAEDDYILFSSEFDP